MMINSERPGCLSPIEGLLLSKLASLVDENNSIVNIGCYKGKSLEYINKYAYATIYGIDINIRDNLPYGVIYIEGSSYDDQIINQIPNNIELLFVDGDHTPEGCYKDLTSYWPKLISGGVMVVHDYYATGNLPNEPGVVEALDKFMNEHKDEFKVDNWNKTYIHKCESCVILQKI